MFSALSLILFFVSTSLRTTKKWWHLSHLTNLVELTKVSTWVQGSPHFGHVSTPLPPDFLPPDDEPKGWSKRNCLNNCKIWREVYLLFRKTECLSNRLSLCTSKYTKVCYFLWFSRNSLNLRNKIKIINQRPLRLWGTRVRLQTWPVVVGSILIRGSKKINLIF